MGKKIRESDLVATIHEGLTYLGCLVLRTGQWRADRAGSDPGCPDLLVRAPLWRPGVWIGMEVKTKEGRLSLIQKWIDGHRGYYVVRSWEDALAALTDASSYQTPPPTQRPLPPVSESSPPETPAS